MREDRFFAPVFRARREPMKQRQDAQRIRSLERDFIVGYAANALLMWVYPLPVVPRPDAVGVAVAPDAVVVFHDGDTLTILPELSAPSSVLIRGNTIEQISANPAATEEGAAVRVIDGNGRVLMPGLIDAHWHMFMAAVSPASS